MATITRQVSLENNISVGLGEIKVTADVSTYLVAFGLGSCIGLCAYDPQLKIAGMAHIVLPKSKPDSKNENASKFADIAIPALLSKLYKYGASKGRLIIKMAGGAQMIQIPGFSSNLEMGIKNIEATRQLLQSNGIRIVAEDVGGSHGRSVWLATASGEVMIRTAGQGIRRL